MNTNLILWAIVHPIPAGLFVAAGLALAAWAIRHDLKRRKTR